MYELIVYITTYHNYCVYCVYIVRVADSPHRLCTKYSIFDTLQVALFYYTYNSNIDAYNNTH